jgi:hypothetical protein
MPDYQKGKIYRIISPSKNLVYYGSTIETLSSRLSKHIYDYKRNNGQKSAFVVLKCEDYKIELVEEYPCNNRQQLEKKEGEYIKANECVNICIAGRTKKEWGQDNRERLNEKGRKYKEEHKEELKQKDKIYIKTKGKEKKIISQKNYRETKKQNNAIYKWLLWTGQIQ